ncbi:hypothetical protein ABC304_06030 [Microbacterium sp. 1P10UB]|uniref:hypothetical protein n=1 Tax=unclassified Microbacterium TaxID=2609290 RepID=UPI0039A0B2D4
MTAPAAATRGRQGSGLDPHSDTFRSFSDVLYTGVLLFALSLPVLTWFAALSAGAQALREAREGDRHVTVGAVWRPFVRRLHRHWFVHVIAPTVFAAVVVLDALILPFLGAGELMSTLVPALLASAVGAVALRVAGAWREDVPARTSVALAWRRMSEDAAGSALLMLAVAAAGAIVSVIPLLAFVMGGPLALAAVAMDRSGRSRT